MARWYALEDQPDGSERILGEVIEPDIGSARGSAQRIWPGRVARVQSVLSYEEARRTPDDDEDG